MRRQAAPTPLNEAVDRGAHQDEVAEVGAGACNELYLLSRY